jgi:hypothetical protein
MRLRHDRRVLIAAVAALMVAPIVLSTGAAAASGSPKAALSIDPASPALTVKFVAQSRNFPAPVVSYHWSFGDGHSATTTTGTVIHTYPSASVFRPSVTETDASHNMATATDTLKLSKCPKGPTECTEALRTTGKVRLLQLTGPVKASPPVPAEINLLAGTFGFQNCVSAIHTAAAATDSGFTGPLTVIFKYVADNLNNVQTTCFSSTVAFIDKAGATVHSGALPTCQPATPSPPCVQSIHVSGQQVTKHLLIPPGDPKVGAP